MSSFTGKPTRKRSKTFAKRHARLATDVTGLFDDLPGAETTIRVRVRYLGGATVQHTVPYGAPLSAIARPGFLYALVLHGRPTIALTLQQRLVDPEVELVSMLRAPRTSD